MAESEISLGKPSKRPRLLDLAKCLFCQQVSKDRLSKPTKDGIKRFKDVAKEKQDELYDFLKNQYGSVDDQISWHANCYKLYTSKTHVERYLCQKENLDPPPKASSHVTDTCANTLFSPLKTRSTAQVSVDWSKCIICQKTYVKNEKRLSQIMTNNAAESLLNAAKQHKDVVLLRVESEDLIAKEAKYHRVCYTRYIVRASPVKMEDDIQGESDVYDQAFDKLLTQINTKLTAEKEVYTMATLIDSYRSILETQNIDGAKVYRSEKLKKRLRKHYGEKIVFKPSENPAESDLVFSSAVSIGDVLQAAKSLNESIEDVQFEAELCPQVSFDPHNTNQILYHAAHILREDINNCNGIHVRPVDLNSVNNECVSGFIPDKLYNFVQCLIQPENDLTKCDYEDGTRDPNDQLHRAVLSISQDILHQSSRGTIKTPKHVGLAVAVRNMTGSKQLITLLNRFGHCCSYDELERIDTSWANDHLAEASQGDGVVIPSNISAGTFVQAAADNDDLIEETLDGKHTTHATTMVLFQRHTGIPAQGSFGEKERSSCTNVRERSLKSTYQGLSILDFNAFGRRPKPSDLLQEVSLKWYTEATQTVDYESLDAAWMFCRLCTTKLFDVTMEPIVTQAVPGWRAFNAIVTLTNPATTNIGYCPMLPEPPTQYSTIYTVMKTIEKMTQSLGQDVTVITFDEAIYCKAKEIQWRQVDEFSDFVIRLGGFHMALTFLASIGKVYAKSGLEDILVEADIYGSTTVDQLIKGRSYNRGVRAHKLLMEAMMRLRWEALGTWVQSQPPSFMADYNEDRILRLTEEFKQLLAEKAMEEVPNTIKNLQEEMVPLLEILKQYCEEKNSPTFTYWNNYVKMVSILIDFIRAERDGLWDLHLSSVALMIPYFFAADRTNYARWSCVYLADMHRLPTTAPYVHRQFLAGNHPVKRSENKFNQVWTDMALEQSVNRDSKTNGGIVGFSLSPGAVNRWFLTAHDRAAITTATKEMAGMTENPNSRHKEQGAKRITRDEKDVQKIVDTIKQTMLNPFAREQPKQLCNLTTGVITPDDVSKDLISVAERGKDAMTAFVTERLNEGKVNFFDPLHKMKLKTFTTVGAKIKSKSSITSNKLASVNEDRALFGRIVVLAKTRDIDMREVFMHELSAVPYSLVHADGTMRKSNKSMLLAELEKDITVSITPSETEPTAWVIDGMAIIHMMTSNLPSTFGELADNILLLITKPFKSQSCHRIDVVFDQYDIPQSIKQMERTRRCTGDSIEISIHRTETPLPKDWKRYLQSSQNKSALTLFLCDLWSNTAPEVLAPGQTLVLAGGYSDGKTVTKITSDGTTSLTQLQSTQEEADTRILLHTADASTTHSNIVVWSPDTDVAVLCIYFMSQLEARTLWFKTGTRDKARYIPIHEIATKLGPDLCEMLPALHAVTGCDSTSAVFSVGKLKPFKWAKKNLEKALSLKDLGTEIQLTELATHTCYSMICQMYDHKFLSGNINDLRYKLFCQKQSRNEDLPPTADSFNLHLKRANYQCYIWKHALQPQPDIPSPIGNGWEEDNGLLMPQLMTLEAAPKSLMQLVICKCLSSKCTGTCTCSSEGMACTAACACEGEDACLNPHKHSLAYHNESCSSDEES